MCAKETTQVQPEKIIEIFFEKLAYFSAPKNNHPTHHVYHANHHNFTTKTPPRNTTFSKTTLKNTSKDALARPATTPRIFSENQAGFFEGFRIPSTWKSFSPAFST